MNKEQSADDPSVDLIRVKNMLNSTISMSALMLKLKYRTWASRQHLAIEAALVKHDNGE